MASAATRPFSASVMLVLVASTFAVKVALMSPMDESMAVLTSLSMSVYVAMRLTTPAAKAM